MPHTGKVNGMYFGWVWSGRFAIPAKSVSNYCIIPVFQYKVVIQYKVIGINASITSDETLVQVSYVSIVLLGQGVIYVL